MVATDRLRGVSASVAIKAPCRVATTANITLSGLQTIDGVTLVADDRVLVWVQSNAVDNGIWIAGTGSWSRAIDFDGAGDCVKGTLVLITSGTLYADNFFRLTSTAPTIGTDNIEFDFVGGNPNSDLGAVTATRVVINPSSSSPADPVGYWTPLYVVANANEDNVVTIRNQTSNVNGHPAIRFQDHEGYERTAFGLGGDHVNNPFRYTAFIDGGNISGDYGTKDTNIMLSISNIGQDAFIPDGTVPILTISASAYDGVTDSGGWWRLGTSNRGVAANAIVADRTGRVGIGPSIAQSAYPSNNGGTAGPTVASVLHVNGPGYFDRDLISGSPLANSTDLVVVRSAATAKASVRVGVASVGSIDIGVAGGNGAIGVDGSIKLVFKTGITGGDLTTGTERMRLDAGILLLGTTINTNAGNGDARLNGALWIKDGMTAPTNAAGFAAIYVDTADGDLKVKFDDGTVKTLATDT